MTQPVNDNSLRQSTAIVSLGTLVSRITGLVRDVVLAGVFGATGVTDAFFAAFRIPNTLRRVLAEGGVTVAVQPVYADMLASESTRESERIDFERAMFTTGRVVLLLITVVGMAAAPLLVDLFAAGFRDDPAVRGEAIFLLRIMFPFVYFIGLIGTAMGLLHTRQHFLAPAIGPALLNLALISGAFTAAYRLGRSGPETTPLAISVLVGVFLFWRVQVWALNRLEIRSGWRLDLRNPQVLGVGKLLLPAVAGLSVYQLQVIVGTQFASFLPVGGFTCLWYADRLIQFPLAMIGTAVGTVALPMLARKRASGEAINDALADALSFAVFLVVPAAIGLYLVRGGLVTTLFGWGQFDAAQAARTAAAVGGFSLALVPAAINRILIPVFYADKRMTVPIVAGAIALVAQALASWLLFDLDVYGLALATAVASTVQFGVLFSLVARSEHRPHLPVAGLLKTSLASGMMALALTAFQQFSAGVDAHVGVVLLAEVGVGAMVYGASCVVLRHQEWLRLADKLRVL